MAKFGGDAFDVLQVVHYSARDLRRMQQREDKKVSKKRHPHYRPSTPLQQPDPIQLAIREQRALPLEIVPLAPAATGVPALDIAHEYARLRRGGNRNVPSGVVAKPSTTDHGRVRFSIGADAIKAAGWAPKERLSIAMLRDGRFAIIKSVNGWLLQYGGRQTMSASLQVPQLSLVGQDEIPAKFEQGHFIFPAGSFIAHASGPRKKEK